MLSTNNILKNIKSTNFTLAIIMYFMLSTEILKKYAKNLKSLQFNLFG